jgi:hypothetical protein
LVVMVKTCPHSHAKVSTSAFWFSQCGSRPTRRMVRLHPGQSGLLLERAVRSGASGINPKRLSEKHRSRKLRQLKIQIRTRASELGQYPMTILRRRATSYSAMRASSASRESFQSGSDRPTSRAARAIGSRARTRLPRRSGVRLRKKDWAGDTIADVHFAPLAVTRWRRPRFARKGVPPRRPERESICHRAPFARCAH